LLSVLLWQLVQLCLLGSVFEEDTAEIPMRKDLGDGREKTHFYYVWKYDDDETELEDVGESTSRYTKVGAAGI
jgi:hypothetical protein